MKSRANDLSNQKFGRLTVIQFSRLDKYRKCRWLCQCDCGNVVEVVSSQLVTGKTRSCGCLKRDMCIERSTKHNGSKTRLFKVWVNIITRCDDSNYKQFYLYGGRGIKLCDEWREFGNFQKWAMENGYDPNAKRNECTIDRIDNDGDYSPDNCRWVNMYVQSRNSRHAHNITYDGKTQCLTDWAKELNITPSALNSRLKKKPVEMALCQ